MPVMVNIRSMPKRRRLEFATWLKCWLRWPNDIEPDTSTLAQLAFQVPGTVVLDCSAKMATREISSGTSEGKMQAEMQLARCFHRAVRERGFEYFRRGRVKIEFGSATEMRATVQGGESYTAIVRRENGVVQVY